MATIELPLSTDPVAKSSEFIFDVALIHRDCRKRQNGGSSIGP